MKQLEMVNLKELSYLAKIGIITVTILLLSAGAYYYSLYPMVKANEADALTLRGKQAEVAQLLPYRAKLEELSRQSEQLKSQMEAQRKIVPEEKEVPALITMVENESVAAGIEVRRYTPKDVSTKEYYVEVPFDVDVDGPFFAVLNFYQRLAKLERIVNVSHMTMGALKTGKSGVRKGYTWAPNETVSANCVLTTYYSTSRTGSAPAKQQVKR